MRAVLNSDNVLRELKAVNQENARRMNHPREEVTLSFSGDFETLGEVLEEVTRAEEEYLESRLEGVLLQAASSRAVAQYRQQWLDVA